jgi:hypothetical protein
VVEVVAETAAEGAVVEDEAVDANEMAREKNACGIRIRIRNPPRQRMPEEILPHLPPRRTRNRQRLFLSLSLLQLLRLGFPRR